MYILQSIRNNAKSFANANWQTETLPMPLRKAQSILANRKTIANNAHRYRLHRIA